MLLGAVTYNILKDWDLEKIITTLEASGFAGVELRTEHAHKVEPSLTPAERELLPAMLRAGALRFWISRLWDFHLPREASMLKPHDPAHFERVLRGRVQSPLTL